MKRIKLCVAVVVLVMFLGTAWAGPDPGGGGGSTPGGSAGDVQCNSGGTALGACSNVTDVVYALPNANTTGSAGSVKSNATTGVMQITGPAAGSTRVATVPDANFTMNYKSGAYVDGHALVADGTGGAVKDGGVMVTYTGEKLATFSWDGGGSAITTGATTKRCLILPFAATITKVYAIADASTTSHLHVYQDAFAVGARSTTVTGAVDISATLGSTDTTLTSWDTSITAEDEICMSVEANDNAKWINVIVFGTR